jgi:GH24 family phage-related lysozyme (muramidase)
MKTNLAHKQTGSDMNDSLSAQFFARRINQNGIDLIKSFEGLFLKAYLCPAGILTIGYGHTRTVTAGMEITRAQAEQFLQIGRAHV